MADVATLTEIVVTALDDMKGTQILELDVKGLTSIADTLIIASGSSSRHVKALAESVNTAAKENGITPLGKEGEAGSEWVLVDLGDVIVHVMLPSARQYYDLESLWSDAQSKMHRQ